MMPTIAFGLIALALVVQVVFLLRKAPGPDPVSHYALIVAAILLVATIVDRSIRIQFVAVTNTYESLVFFSGMIALLLFAYRMQRRVKVLPFVMFGGSVMALALLSITSAPIAPSEISPPIPSLQS